MGNLGLVPFYRELNRSADDSQELLARLVRWPDIYLIKYLVLMVSSFY
jgi:hypothetical protein